MKTMDMPKLNAVSDKQREYAESLRATALDASTHHPTMRRIDQLMIDSVEDVAHTKADARFWLDNKDPIGTLVMEKFGVSNAAVVEISRFLEAQDQMESLIASYPDEADSLKQKKVSGVFHTFDESETLDLIHAAGSRDKAEKLAAAFGLTLHGGR